MSDIDKLIRTCNNLKMLRNQVSMDGSVNKKRFALIDSLHTEQLVIKAHNEHEALKDKVKELEGLILELNGIEVVMKPFINTSRQMEAMQEILKVAKRLRDER